MHIERKKKDRGYVKKRYFRILENLKIETTK